ncbi:MAG: LysM peptidoglycan-binding domain-containing protein [Planctomycetota bacterium]
MKPSTLVALLAGVLVIGILFIVWIAGGFENKEPIVIPPPEEPITSTLTAFDPLSGTGLVLTGTMTAEPVSNSYTVQPGDTLWSIAKQFYNGDGTKSKLIAEANKDKLPNPNKLKVGTEIVIPPSGSSTMPMGRTEPAQEQSYNTSEGQNYTVRKGDTLSSISKKFYGTVNKRGVIVSANSDKLATESTTLKVGWKLVIPKLSKSPSKTSTPTSTPTKPADNVPSGASEEGPG